MITGRRAVNTKFPDDLPHPSGVRMDLDVRRLCVAFAQEPSGEKLTNALRSTGFEPEGDDATESKRHAIVNDTGLRSWIRWVGVDAPTDQHLEALEKALSTLAPLIWIGPAYRLGGKDRPGSVVCPVPNVLVIKPRQEDYGTLAHRLSQYGLEEDTEKSRYMGELRHYKVLDPGERNALDLRPILLDQEQQLIEDILFEHMPMLVPLCSIPEDPLFGWEGDITKIEAGLDVAALDGLPDSAPVDMCILDSGVDRSHPDLLVGPGINV